MQNPMGDSAHSGIVPQKQTYTASEIARQLSISFKAAYRLIREQQFKSIRVGSCIRVSKQSFDEWLNPPH